MSYFNVPTLNKVINTYLESWFSFLGRGAQKILKKKKKTDRRKTMKNEEKEASLLFLLYKKLCFVRKYSLQKSSLHHHILFTVFMR